MKRFLPFTLSILCTILGMNSAAALAGTNVWTSVGPDGGRVQAIAVAPQNPDTVYALAGGSIFKTTDGAVNWKLVYPAATSGGTANPAVVVAIHPQDSNTVYVGTANGVIKSTDGGASWITANTGLPKPLLSIPIYGSTGCTTGLCVRILAIDPWNPETIYAVVSFLPYTTSGVFKSTDGGASWSDASSGLFVSSANPQDFSGYAFVTSLVIDPQDPNTLYAAASAGSSGGLFKSTDGGANWTRDGLARNAGAALAIDPRNPNTLYAWGTSPPDGVLKSTDGGANWSAASSGFPPGYDEILSLTIDPQNPDMLYASVGACHVIPCTYSGVFKSTDGGTSWTGSGLAYSPAPTVLAIDPINPKTVYAGTYNGIVKSLDAGASWNAANSGLAASQIDSLSIDPQNAGGLFAITRGKVLRTADGGAHWSEFYTPLPSDDGRATYPASTLVADPSALGTFYLGVGGGNEEGGGGILKSTDDGTSWKRMPLPGPGGVVTLKLDPQNPNTLFVATIRALYKSTDAGASWNLLFGTNQRNYEMPSWCIVSAVVDPWNPSTLYVWACLPDGRSQGLFKSIDGGQTWSSLGNPLTSGLFGALAIDPQNSGTLYVSGFYDGVLKTTDGGQNWKAFTFTSGLPATGISMRSIAVDPRNSNIVYGASSGLGVFWSTNGGASWRPLNTGLTNLNVQTLLIDPQNPDTLYAGTYQGGVFAMSFPR